MWCAALLPLPTLVSGQVPDVDAPVPTRVRCRPPVQDDLLYETLTVFETLYFAAMLRLPAHMSKAQKKERVEVVIKALGLTRCRDTIIGEEVDGNSWPALGTICVVVSRLEITLGHCQRCLPKGWMGLCSVLCYRLSLPLNQAPPDSSSARRLCIATVIGVALQRCTPWLCLSFALIPPRFVPPCRRLLPARRVWWREEAGVCRPRAAHRPLCAAAGRADQVRRQP